MEHTMLIPSTTAKWIENIIIKKLITSSSRVHVYADAYGQYVDVDYEYNPELDIVGNYKLIFAELYEDGHPDKRTWKDALAIGRYVSTQFHIPLVVE